MSTNQQRAKRAAHDLAYEQETEACSRREAEYDARWKDLFAALEKAGIDPYELKTWIEEGV
jgi:hypothetical protein